MILAPQPSRADGTFDEYRALAVDLERSHSRHVAVLRKALRELSTLAWDLTPKAEIRGRVKSLSSTWLKMRRTGLTRSGIVDSVGVRVIVAQTPECYRLADRVRGTFELVPDAEDDYIAAPKANGYMSLHTALVMPGGDPVELQLRTAWMHANAERGEAAHWRYKLRAAQSLQGRAK